MAVGEFHRKQLQLGVQEANEGKSIGKKRWGIAQRSMFRHRYAKELLAYKYYISWG